MNTYKASDILKNTRVENQSELSDISKKTKIPLKYLQAIEDGDCQGYPSEPYCSLFVGKYAQYLGLDGEKIVSLFRRDLNQKPVSQFTKKQPIYLTPQFIFSTSVGLLIILMFSFLLSRYLSFNRSPSLTVLWPDNISKNEVKISGTTDSSCSVRINQDLIIIDQDGNFEKVIDISKNPLVEVEATSPYGKKTKETHQFTQEN